MIYGQFMKRAKDKHKCPLCLRMFASEEEFKSFLGKVCLALVYSGVACLPIDVPFSYTMSMLISVNNVLKLDGHTQGRPEQEAELSQEIAHLEKRRDALRSLQFKWNALVRLRDIEIPEVECEVVELSAKKNASRARIEEVRDPLVWLYRIQTLSSTPASNTVIFHQMEIDVDTFRTKIKALESLWKKIEELNKFEEEITNCDREVLQLEQELAISGTTKTMGELRKKLDELHDRGYVEYGPFLS